MDAARAVQPGQAFCSKCGKQIVGPISFMRPRPGRVQEHVRLLALLWLALSAFNTIGGIALYVVANTVLVHVHRAGADSGPPAFLTPLLSTVAILLLAKAASGSLPVGACCNAIIGLEWSCSSWPLLVCSPTFPSERRSAFIRCGFFCPLSQSRSTTAWPRRERRHNRIGRS